MPELTERQRIILESITEGLTNKAIADKLGISEDVIMPTAPMGIIWHNK